MEPWLKPMLCTPVDEVPEGPEWVLEPKLDGWRFVVYVTGRGVLAYGGRNGSDYSRKLPYIEETITAIVPPDTALDGELVAPAGWGDVQGIMTRGDGPHVPDPHNPPLNFVVFDVLRIGGTDCRANPWQDRRAVIESLITPARIAHAQVPAVVQLIPAAPASKALHDVFIEKGFEGTVCKRRSAHYYNTRSPHFVKIKPQDTTEAEVIGFKAGKAGGRFDGKVGAFNVKLLKTGAETTVKCGTDETHDDALANPDNWLGKIIEIKHHGWQPSGKVRHPMFLRRRDDRTPADPAPVRKAQTAPKAPVNGDWVRNYGAMGGPKLLKCIAELDAGAGDAVNRVEQNGGSLERNLDAAKAAARSKGLI